MRIIAGKYRSRIIDAPNGMKTRPTASRVRESLFSILGVCLQDANILDLFAGSGALGLESISRGAKSAVFVDNGRSAVGVIEKNCQALAVDDVAIRKKDVMAFLGGKDLKREYDIIFIDPPYSKDLGPEILRLIGEKGWLDAKGTIVLEESSQAKVTEKIGNLILAGRREYGDTALFFFRFAEGATE